MDLLRTAALPEPSHLWQARGLACRQRLPTRMAQRHTAFLTFDRTTGELLGATHMIRADLYHGQPCPQLGGLCTFNPLNGYCRRAGLLKREVRAGCFTAARSPTFLFVVA